VKDERDALGRGRRFEHDQEGHVDRLVEGDSVGRALARGRSLAADRGLERRATFIGGSADAWQQPADRVICVGVAHAWGGAEAALTAATRLVKPGGRLLFGDGCWERSPTEEAAKLCGDAVLTLSQLVECAQRASWRILHLSTADQREWDAFESTWRAGLQEWLLANPQDERAPTVRDELDTRSRSTSASIEACSASATSSSAGKRTWLTRSDLISIARL
jgi:SAM-dependent methyltransferase